MEVVYFAEPAIGLQPKYSDHPEGGIIGSALLFYEGSHVDNAGKAHEVPAERINLFALNTNRDFAEGKEIPLMVEHSKTLIGANGVINKLGKLASPVFCREIQESDLPNPKMQDLVGKIGAFAQVHVVNRLDEVKNRTIRALSAGIDPVKNKFIEISAVAFPSLSGASLLFSARQQANFASHGLTDYNLAKERVEAWEKPYQELFKKFDIFAGTLQAIDLEAESSEFNFNTNQLKRKALEQLTEDLVDYLDISFEETNEEESDIYNSNPYDVNVVKNHAAVQHGKVLNFNQTARKKMAPKNSDCRKKRIRRGVNEA